MNANERQVGGDHYSARTMAWDMIIDNNMGYLTGAIIKYLVRWERKGNPQDLEKAEHFLEKLKQSVAEGRVIPTGGPRATGINGLERNPIPFPTGALEDFRKNREQARAQELDRIAEQNKQAATASC